MLNLEKEQEEGNSLKIFFVEIGNFVFSKKLYFTPGKVKFFFIFQILCNSTTFVVTLFCEINYEDRILFYTIHSIFLEKLAPAGVRH